MKAIGGLLNRLIKRNRNINYSIFSNYDPLVLDQVISYVIPAYNAEISIYQVLSSLYKNTVLPLNIVVILDACTDNTAIEIQRWITCYIESRKRKIWLKTITTSRSIQETSCDNLGFKEFPNSEVIVDIQADIIISEKNFDLKILKIFKDNPDIFALSNRGTHPWPRNYTGKITVRTFLEIIRGIVERNYRVKKMDLSIAAKSKNFYLDKDKFYSRKEFGRLGEYTELEPFYENSTRSIWLGETVMRGPLAFRNSALKELGYLNDKSHPLAGDDHELTLRAWRKLRLRAAYCPMSYSSPLRIGADRRPKPLKEEFRNIRWRFLQWIYSNQSALCTLVDPTKEILPTYEHRMVNFQND
jgi:glycosyltransferase involved in cell wall biosynthesis